MMEDAKESCDDIKTDVSNSSGSKDLSKTLPVEAFDNFLQGKRHMLVQDYQFAVDSLADACQMYVEHFGELAIECAEVYFLYGKALFRLSQQQAGVLGGALNEGSNEEENSSESEGKENESDKNSESEGKENESDKNSDGEEAEDNDQEGNEQEDKEEKEPSESTDSPLAVVDEGSSEAKQEGSSEAKQEGSAEAKSEGSCTTKTENNSEVKSQSSSEVETEVNVKAETSECMETAGTSNEEESEKSMTHEAPAVEESMNENNEAEEDDLELAWNTLETAKSIFKRRDTVESQLKVAEILQLLAEISMESDNNPAAIGDLTECLEIQKKHLKPDDRILAETYYQMGLALMLDKIYPEALVNFHKTRKILELRVTNLKSTPVDDADGTFASADIEAEVADLETILHDIKEKIDDTEELICNKKKELEESSFDEPGSSTPFKEKEETSTSSKPISNITHLLKRKKPDEGTSDDGAKRIKITGVLNGDSKVATAPEATNAEA